MKRHIAVLALIAAAAFTATAQEADTPEAYAAFISVVEAELASYAPLEIEKHYEESYFKILAENPHFLAPSEVGLFNLYSTCLAQRRTRWPKIVKDHFGAMSGMAGELKKVEADLATFETAKPLLRFRLYPVGYEAAQPLSCVVDRRIEGCLGVVVVDLPRSAMGLPDSYLEKWGISAPECVAVAIANTNSTERGFVQVIELATGYDCTVISGNDDIYLTTGIFALADRGLGPGEYGRFVAFPTREVIVTVLISKEQANRQAALMCVLAERLVKFGPGVITTDVYWYDGVGFHPLRHDPERGLVILPDGLVERLSK